MAVVLGVLAAGAASRAQAQIQGMPLFTNPRYATGFRVHADLGLPTDTKVGLGDYSVIQGGVTFALGPVGLGANVGATRNDFKNISNGTGGTVGAQTKITASALAQLRVYGGGASPFALSLFGGASMDVQAYQFSGLADSIKTQLGGNSKVLTIPVGAALGIKLPLVIVNPNLWAAPRLNFTKLINCGTTCPSSKSEFRWAVGLDVPIFRIISVRAAFDSGKLYGTTVNNFGVGASIGIGGMR
ncbi:MAG TPA: hypothetical protein VMF70_11830 [Gemmatimonadales bacterium]|nr:hypothetical protein [Gemmatimonadales bacterium]